MSKTYYHDQVIELQRGSLLKRKEILKFKDLGAGSHRSASKSIAELAKTSTSNKWKCKLVQNLALEVRPSQVLEFGTNLGLMTSYLSHALSNASIHTVEGASQIAEVAQSNFQKLNCKNIQLHTSTFDDFIELYSGTIRVSEFVFIDGNHSYDGTMELFNSVTQLRNARTVIVIDDINWSEGMRQFWKELISSQKYTTLDIFKMGVVFHNYESLSINNFKCIPRIFKPWQLGFFG